MTILIDESTRVIIQGITGKTGQQIAWRMQKHGTPLVGGVTPGKGGQEVFGIPVYNSVEEVVKGKKANCSLVVVPAPFVKDAVLESLDAGIRLIVIYTEGVPIHDACYIVNYGILKNCRIFGPNSAGVMSPGKCNVSDLNDDFVIAGNIGIVSKSGTLAYEVIDGISHCDLGVSTVCCLGGDPVIGTNYTEILKLFESDKDTKAVILLGEVGGTAEIEAAKYIKHINLQVFAYVAGLAAPQEKRMGHAGAIVTSTKDKASYKKKVLEDAGAITTESINDLLEAVSTVT